VSIRRIGLIGQPAKELHEIDEHALCHDYENSYANGTNRENTGSVQLM
jgi:hypothetical protein